MPLSFYIIKSVAGSKVLLRLSAGAVYGKQELRGGSIFTFHDARVEFFHSF